MRILGAILLLLHTSSGVAQVGRTWVVGSPAVIVGTDSPSFSSDTFDHDLNTHSCFAVGNDGNGKLTLLTTGTRVFNSAGNFLEAGDTLCGEQFYNKWEKHGLLSDQAALIFPRGNNQYWIIHMSVSDSQMIAIGVPTIYDEIMYAEADMNANGGLGKITSKRNVLMKDSFHDDHFTACKHANGRDYWLVTNRLLTNTYIKFLVRPDSILGPFYQQIGTTSQVSYSGGLTFSPDGSRFAALSFRSKLNIFDFDRCTGEFSNPRVFDIPMDSNWNGNQLILSGGGGQGLAFSPSGRFLYALCFANIRQYDLLTNQDQLIWRWDSTYGMTFTSEGNLAYNGKILVSNYHGVGSKGFHTIDYPDSLGLACHFQWSSFKPKTLNYNTLNNTFNYRLGPLMGSGCDTLAAVRDVGIENGVSIYPNPATKDVTVELLNYLKDAELKVYNVAGQCVFYKPDYYLAFTMETERWPPGEYVVEIGNKSIRLRDRLIKQ